jgi:hypothetical protein
MASDNPKEPVMINPPDPLRSKVTGGGGPNMEMLAKAEAEIKEVGAGYTEWTMKDIERLAGLHAPASENPAERRERISEIFDVSHDMRGQRTSFDYPLMTRICESLCRFADELEQVDQKALDLVRTYIEAMRAVITYKVSGEKNELAQQIASGLEIASEKWKAAAGKTD